MIRKLLVAITRLALDRPGLLIASMALPALIGLAAVEAPLDFSFAGIMDRSHPEVQRYFAASERYGVGGLVPVLLEGDETQLDDAVLELELAVDDLEVVRSFSTGIPRDWLLPRTPWLVDRETFEGWLRLAEQPTNRAVLQDLQARLEAFERDHSPPSPKGYRLVLVTLEHDSFQSALDADDFPQLRAAAQIALAPFDVEARFAGMAAIITQEQEATIVRMRVLGPLSLLLVVTLLSFIDRRPAMLFSMALPMLLAVACTLGIIALTEGNLTIMESVFGLIVFGLGVDFGIHLLIRLREELDRGHGFERSLSRAIAGTGRGIVAGGVTTGGAFLILALAPDPVFQRLGLSGGLGLLLCLVFLCVLLPAEWVLLERRAPMSAQPRPALRIPGLRSIARFATRRPQAILAVSALLVCFGALGLSEIRYETNLEKVFSRDIDAVETAQKIHSIYGLDPGPWIVGVEDMDEARRVTREFSEHPLFVRSESLAFLFPEDRAERSEGLTAIAPALAADIRRLETEARGLPGVEADALRESLDLLSVLLSAESIGPPTIETLPPALSERLLGPDGEPVVYAFVAEPSLDSARAARERAAAQSIHPGATSMSAIYEALIGTDRPWMPPLTAGVLAFIAFVLYLDLRSVRLMVLALLPVATASVVALGLLSFAGFSFNTVTLVAVPLVLGLGVDDGIHIVHRILEEPGASLDEITESVGVGVTMTTLTTCASVATLLFTRHPGIESIAVLLLVSLPLCWLASITVLPAFAVLAHTQRLARARANAGGGA